MLVQILNVRCVKKEYIEVFYKVAADCVFIYTLRLSATAYTIRQLNQSIIGVISIHRPRIYPFYL
jgi:hypothetical protein